MLVDGMLKQMWNLMKQNQMRTPEGINNNSYEKMRFYGEIATFTCHCKGKGQVRPTLYTHPDSDDQDSRPFEIRDPNIYLDRKALFMTE